MPPAHKLAYLLALLMMRTIRGWDNDDNYDDVDNNDDNDEDNDEDNDDNDDDEYNNKGDDVAWQQWVGSGRQQSDGLA